MPFPNLCPFRRLVANHSTANVLTVVYLSLAIVHIFNTNKCSGDHIEKIGTNSPREVNLKQGSNALYLNILQV